MDMLCVGMGMGVPIFCILFGFAVGWYIARRAVSASQDVQDALTKVFVYAFVTSLITFVGMCIIWVPALWMLFNPSTDFATLGIPLILYDPKLSFIGFEVLMVFISPFLQLLTTIFAAYLTLLHWSRKHRQAL